MQVAKAGRADRRGGGAAAHCRRLRLIAGQCSVPGGSQSGRYQPGERLGGARGLGSREAEVGPGDRGHAQLKQTSMTG